MSSPTSHRSIPNTAYPSYPQSEVQDSKMGTAAVSTSTGQGLARNPSFRQARPVRKSLMRNSSSFLDQDGEIEEAKTLNTQLIADLKDQVQRAEQLSEQYRKQVEFMQKRLDNATAEQTVSEERDFQRQTEIDRLRAEIKDSIRHHRELELFHDSEKRLLLQDKERQTNKEADLQEVIQRLNENLRLRQGADMAQPSSDPSTSIADNLYEERLENLTQKLQIKEEILDTLKLELAEAHIRMAEQEHISHGQFQVVEKQMLDMKLTNARLVEENESFQMLLSEKTLRGDFTTDARAIEDTSGMSTLAEELALAGDENDGQHDLIRRLEMENRSLRDSNKALTLYVDKIIGRLLQHEGFEHIIHDKEGPLAPPPPAKLATDKSLPITPPKTIESVTPAPAVQQATGIANGFLQRAKSVVSKSGPRPRPISVISPPIGHANENPDTAPSIPLSRGHRRTRSDQNQMDPPATPTLGTTPNIAAAAVVQQMNRGSPLRTTPGGPLSPRITPLRPQLNQGRVSYFQPPSQPSLTARPPSSSGTPRERGSSTNSIASDQSTEPEANDPPSAQTSTYAPTVGMPSPNIGASIPGAVMKQNQLRPLRLVQEKHALDEEQKKANRQSWMGWFRGGTNEVSHQE